MIKLDLACDLLTKKGGGVYGKGGAYLWKKNQNHFSDRMGRAITSISNKYPSSKVFEIKLQKQIYISISIYLSLRDLFSYSHHGKTKHSTDSSHP